MQCTNLEISTACLRDLCSKKINATQKNGATALFAASAAGNVDCVKTILVFGGAVVDQEDSDGNTPFMIASRNGFDDVAKLLLKAGADRRRRRRKRLQEPRNWA